MIGRAGLQNSTRPIIFLQNKTIKNLVTILCKGKGIR